MLLRVVAWHKEAWNRCVDWRGHGLGAGAWDGHTGAWDRHAIGERMVCGSAAERIAVRRRVAARVAFNKRRRCRTYESAN